MDFRILGPLEVSTQGQPLDLGGQKQRALLAALLLEANRVVSQDRLIEALWEDDPPETAQKALQVHVSQLRKALGKERLVTKAPGYMLHVEPDELDVECFQRLAEEGKLAEALSLWRGAALSEFAYQRFAQGKTARLEELRLACLEGRIEDDLARGRHAELTGELEALVREYPLRERLRGQLRHRLQSSRCGGEIGEPTPRLESPEAAGAGSGTFRAPTLGGDYSPPPTEATIPVNPSRVSDAGVPLPCQFLSLPDDRRAPRSRCVLRRG